MLYIEVWHASLSELHKVVVSLFQSFKSEFWCLVFILLYFIMINV